METHEELRPYLFAIAYRMLGSVADAEDVVQEAFLRWHAADRSEIDNVEAFLVRVVTRLCLDVLKSARRRRETYIGPWLPEPLWFLIKVFVLVVVFIWVRATMPRLRYDRLMKLGWKVFLPLATLNLLVTAIVVGLGFAHK